jgi:hypothetical protein
MRISYNENIYEKLNNIQWVIGLKFLDIRRKFFMVTI